MEISGHESCHARPHRQGPAHDKFCVVSRSVNLVSDLNMNKTRLSLLYLGSYLLLIGLGLLFEPDSTLKLLQSNAEYGNVFPRVAGMLMSGLGFSVFGIIRAGVPSLYAATIFIRSYFLVCLATFYGMTDRKSVV